jgi:hypothetical protein
METLWDFIKYLYKKHFNIPGDVIEYYSLEPILKRSITGYSNTRLAYSYNITSQDIKNILNKYMGFDGWNNDLDVNPLAIYNRYCGNYLLFTQEIKMVSTLMDDFSIDLSFVLCKRFVAIQRMIEAYVS